MHGSGNPGDLCLACVLTLLVSLLLRKAKPSFHHYWREKDLMGGLLKGWGIGWIVSSRRCTGQQFNVKMEISDRWCSLGLCIALFNKAIMGQALFNIFVNDRQWDWVYPQQTGRWHQTEEWCHPGVLGLAWELSPWEFHPNQTVLRFYNSINYGKLKISILWTVGFFCGSFVRVRHF